MDDPDASPDKFLALKVLQSYLHIIDSEYLRQNTTSTDLSIEMLLDCVHQKIRGLIGR